MLEASTLDLHPCEKLGKDIQELPFHLVVEGLPPGFRVGKEQRVKHRLRDNIVKLFEKLPPHSLLLLKIYMLSAF
jgi:hypothetical protein